MYLLFDVGGTKTRVAVMRDFKVFDEPTIFLTDSKYNDWFEKFVEVSKKLIGDENLLGIAGGAPGPVNRDNINKYLGGPNLSTWKEKPLVKDISNEFGVDVFFNNDAAVVGLGEAIFGAGRGEEIVAYITVSTGLGGARIVEGSVDKTVNGFEPGHHIIDINSSYCSNCKSGKIGDMISGAAIRHRFGKPAEKLLQDAACWDELAEWLAIGLNNVMVFWSPDVIVLGGSMITGNPAIQINEVERYLKNLDTIFESPPIKKAELGDLGGLYGAMALLKKKLG